MVKLNKIYTKTGDKGSTQLGNGKRVEKNSLRVDAYGSVDEANAARESAINQFNATVDNQRQQFNVNNQRERIAMGL